MYSWQELSIRNKMLFLLERENYEGSTGFTVLYQIECSRVNWSFPGKERCLSKRFYEKRKSAEEHVSYIIVTSSRYPIAKTPVASRSGGEREDDDDRDEKQKRRVLRDLEQRALCDE